MAAGRVHRRHKLESVERFAARVHLLKDQADGFVRSVGAQRDHGELVGLEVLENVFIERLEKIGFLEVAFLGPESPKTHHPVHRVEDLVERKH